MYRMVVATAEAKTYTAEEDLALEVESEIRNEAIAFGENGI